MAAEEAVDPPKSISFDSIVMDVCCHPLRDIVAVGDIDGQVTVHSYLSSGSNHQLMSFSHHKKSCRCVRFNVDGSRLVTASKDKSLRIVDMVAGRVSQSFTKAHESAIFSLLVISDNILATGDDDGVLKVWDLRHQKPIMEVHESEDYLSDMVIDPTKRILLATSGEGTLSAYDIRKHKLVLQSELLDSALLSIAVVKNGSKVVCGSDEGALNIFNWGEWGNISDRFPGHPMSVDAIIPVTENIVCTGASDGVIRAVSILPNRIIGSVGDHSGFPVEALSLSHCRCWLVSCSHDQQVKFSDVRQLPLQTVDAHKKKKTPRNTQTAGLKASTTASFFEDLNPSSDRVDDHPSESVDQSDDSGSDPNDSESDDVKTSDVSADAATCEVRETSLTASGARDKVTEDCTADSGDGRDSSDDDRDSSESGDDCRDEDDA